MSLAFGICCTERVSIILLLTLMVTYLLGWNTSIEMAYIFIVKYSVLFSLFNFGLGLGLLNLASASTLASRFWPWPRPQVFGLGLGLGLKHLASINISDVIWDFYLFIVCCLFIFWLNPDYSRLAVSLCMDNFICVCLCKGSGYGTVLTVPLFCGDGTVNMYTSRLLLMVLPVAGSEDEP